MFGAILNGKYKRTAVKDVYDKHMRTAVKDVYDKHRA